MDLPLQVEHVDHAVVIGVVGVGVLVGHAHRPAQVPPPRHPFGDLPLSAPQEDEVPLQHGGGQVQLGVAHLRGDEPGLAVEADLIAEAVGVRLFPGELDELEGDPQLGLGQTFTSHAEQGQRPARGGRAGDRGPDRQPFHALHRFRLPRYLTRSYLVSRFGVQGTSHM